MATLLDFGSVDLTTPRRAARRLSITDARIEQGYRPEQVVPRPTGRERSYRGLGAG